MTHKLSSYTVCVIPYRFQNNVVCDWSILKVEIFTVKLPACENEVILRRIFRFCSFPTGNHGLCLNGTAAVGIEGDGVHFTIDEDKAVVLINHAIVRIVRNDILVRQSVYRRDRSQA